MDIKIGELYENKTWRFLVPCLHEYGNVFIKKLETVFKLGVAIHDNYLDGAELANGRNLYIMLDTKFKPKDYISFIDYIRYHESYRGEYCPNSEIVNSRKHVVILEIPEKYFKAYENFLRGKYSEMYSQNELDFLFTKPESKNYKILSKTGDVYKEHKEVLEKTFKVENIDLESVKSGEWELPLKNKWGYKPKFGIYKSGYVRVLISHKNVNAYQINPCIKSFFGWMDKYLKVHRHECKQRVLIDYRHLRYEYLVTYILKNYGKYLQRQD